MGSRNVFFCVFRAAGVAGYVHEYLWKKCVTLVIFAQVKTLRWSEVATLLKKTYVIAIYLC